jgi:8-oxo-dGTP pyrophosphatase MutT (NUDIX family)
MPETYKIFIRDIALFISENAPPGAEMLTEDIISPGIIDLLITKAQNSTNKHFVITNHSPSNIYKLMQQVLKPVQSAGGIVWNQEGHLLMIYRRGKWDLPKGKVEKGESLETAALREVEEESGVGKLRLLEKFDISYHIYYEVNTWVIKETHWFEMLSSDKGLVKPQESEGITEVKWVPLSKIESKLKNTYPSISDLIHRAISEGYKVIP